MVNGKFQNNWLFTPEVVAKREASKKKNLEDNPRTHCRKGHLYTPETTIVTKNGYRTCKICYNEARRLWREANMPKRVRATHENRKAREKSDNLKRKFGITLEEYKVMFDTQGGCCAICGIHQDNIKRALAVDHCHHSNEIRALLCTNCNSGIGMLQDSLEIVQKALDYLLKYKKEINE